jgi:hypothetical protein
VRTEFSHHCKCLHPDVKEIVSSPMVELFGILGGMGKRTEPFIFKPENFKVKINEHGFNNGWANFPVNFDTIWIEACDGFDSKNENKPTPKDCKNSLKCIECPERYKCFSEVV